MARTPELVAAFLAGRRIAVAGVSRGKQSAANPIFRKLRDSGYEVIPVNPNAAEVESVPCYPDLASVPGAIHGVVVATHPAVSAAIVQQAAERGVRRVWLHRSFGAGSVSPEAIAECAKRGIACIAGGCPVMYSEPVDLGHCCMRGLLGWIGRLPK